MLTAFTAAHRGGSGPPLVLLHGFMDTWRTWELVLPALEGRHDVLAPTLPGHAGGPPLPRELHRDALVDAVERMMDAAGLATAHIAGNSLGGHIALRLAARGRARSVVALAPAGGWADGDDSWRDLLERQRATHAEVARLAPHAEAILATDDGRRGATRSITVRYRHIPPALLAHQMRGVAACDAGPMIDLALGDGWEPPDARLTACPVRIVWGTEDALLPWPSAAAGLRARFPHADWVQLDGVGHAPQLDVPLVCAELILGMSARA